MGLNSSFTAASTAQGLFLLVLLLVTCYMANGAAAVATANRSHDLLIRELHKPPGDLLASVPPGGFVSVWSSWNQKTATSAPSESLVIRKL